MSPAGKHKILVVCPYPVGVAPSQRLKYEQYFHIFQEEGFEIKVKPFVTSALWKVIYKKGNFLNKFIHTIVGYWKRFWLLFSLRKYDVVYIHLWITPFFIPLYEWLYCMVAKKVIYDIDDLVYLRNNKSNANMTVGFFKSRKKPIYLIKHSDHVITCTPYLDEFVKKFNPNTTDISSTVDTDRYVPVNTYHPSQPITLGWSGSITTSVYFILLKEVLQEISKKYQVKVLVMGNADIRIPGVEIEALSWSEEAEIQTLQRFDIGLYPLPNEEWVLGKSGLKAIQYMALGIPTVATGIGANFRVIEHGKSGLLVNTKEEWIEALSKLIESPELRKELGKNARLKIESEFSIEANKENYLKVLRSVLKKS